MLDLSEEQRMLVEETRRLAENEFAETAFTWEGEGYPEENIETLAEHGFLGINLPMEYGGGGMTEFDVALQIETVGRVCPDTAAAIYGISMVSPRAIEMFGSEWAKEHYLPKVTSGETSVAIGISEPEAGSDSQNMSTTVEEAADGELYLNGEKIWVSNVMESEAAVIWAKFPEGLGTVIMDFDQPGVEIAQHYTNMHGEKQTQFYMEDVHVPEEKVLVRGPQALKEQLKALNWERCGSSMLANSIALNAFDKAVDYAEDRVQFDQPIGEFQGMRWKIADMAKRLEASRSLTYRAAMSADEEGAPDRLKASIAKLMSGETVERVVSEALQVHGANGYQQGHPLEYLYRMARGRRIAAGTDEIMKNNIADVVFEDGLPGTF
jgi:alkylation response protein AidB-like acyl-CoA dehydrogenase